MLAAFGITSSKVFGSVANRRYFTLYRTDITMGNIFKMLPGGDKPKPIDIDNQLPFNGAYYDDQSTWSLVPLQNNGPQKGKIRNILLAQTITLWFNIQNSSTLGSISLVDDTLVTRKTASCGSNAPVGEATRFGLPHSVIVYLNGGNGYDPTVEGLFQLANDVLGGVETSISPSAVNQAVNIINNAFDECRVLVGTIPYDNAFLTQTMNAPKGASNNLKVGAEPVLLKVIAYPNPYSRHFQLRINSSESGIAIIQFFTITGQKLYEMRSPVRAHVTAIIPYTGPNSVATLTYTVTVGKNNVSGIVLKPN